MAIFHYSAQIITRGKGQSAVAAAAYRHGARMRFEREGRELSYEGKDEVVAGEVTLPADAPDWIAAKLTGTDRVADSAIVWNAVESFERREDGQLARELVVALPLELSRDDNIALLRELAAHFNGRGQIVDWAYHDMPDNPHAHIMLTLRPLTEDGFGAKTVPLRDADGEVVRAGEGAKSRIVYRPFFGTKEDLKLERALWADLVNAKLEARGVAARVDHRSFADRDIPLQPTTHRGLAASQMRERGMETDRFVDIAAREQANAEIIRRDPDVVLRLLTERESVFGSEAIAKALLTYVQTPELFTELLARVTASPSLVGLMPEVAGRDDSPTEAALLTTRDFVRLETDMVARAIGLHGTEAAPLPYGLVEATIAESAARRGFAFSDGQIRALKAITGPTRLSLVLGRAGAGKSTLLAGAREVWEASGLRVVGLSLAGKAAQELERASGISSATLAAFDLRVRSVTDTLGSRHVVVLDEAGMVGSKDLAVLLDRVEAAGAQLVLVGDPDQLPPIAAGAAFRAVAEHVGAVELDGIRRQSADWMRTASLDLAEGRVVEAVKAYAAHDAIKVHAGSEATLDAVANAFVADWSETSDVLALAHSNAVVRELNARIRARLREAGQIQSGARFETRSGPETFGAGDRVVFLRNDRRMGPDGVRNGQLGTVAAAERGRLSVDLGTGAPIWVDDRLYSDLAPGFATTIHKSQGMTVGRTHLLVQRSTTRNLAYVGMTRHRDALTVHHTARSFSDEKEFPKGLVSALERAEVKAHVLDHLDRPMDAVRAFADRRGLTVAVETRRWFVKPREGNSYRLTVAEAAAQRAVRSPAYAQARERVQASMERVFSKADARLTDLEARLLSGASAAVLKASLQDETDLLGDGRRLASRAQKDQRSRALRAQRVLKQEVSDWVAVLGQQTEIAARNVEEERRLDAQGIRHLDEAALQLVALYAETGEDGVLEEVTDDVRAQLRDFNAAVERRFGHVAEWGEGANEPSSGGDLRPDADIVRAARAFEVAHARWSLGRGAQAGRGLER